MGTKGVSKYVSLVWLLEVQANYYRAKDGTDYDQEEVDNMILAKEDDKASKEVLRMIKEFNKVA